MTAVVGIALALAAFLALALVLFVGGWWLSSRRRRRSCSTTTNPKETTQMENQHRKISGYRELSQAEIDAMNDTKALAEQCGTHIKRLESAAAQEGGYDPDKRALAIARTKLQEGFMWLNRSIAKPTTFALLLISLLFVASCVASADGTRSSAIVAGFTIRGADGGVIAWGRTDYATTVIHAAVDVELVVYQKASDGAPNGLPLIAPTRVKAGKTYVFQRGDDLELELDAPLPENARALMRAVDVEELAITYEAKPAPTP